jgi:hypothetical protein
MQENLLKLMQEVTKMSSSKRKKKDKKGSKSHHDSSSKSKKKSKSKDHRSSHSSKPAPKAKVEEITYAQKRELAEKISVLDPDHMESVLQIIRNGMPHLDDVCIIFSPSFLPFHNNVI